MLPAFAKNERDKSADGAKMFDKKARIEGPTSEIAGLLKKANDDRACRATADRFMTDKTPVRNNYVTNVDSVKKLMNQNERTPRMLVQKAVKPQAKLQYTKDHINLKFGTKEDYKVQNKRHYKKLNKSQIELKDFSPNGKDVLQTSSSKKVFNQSILDTL